MIGSVLRKTALFFLLAAGIGIDLPTVQAVAPPAGPPTSACAANYYELKPGLSFISLGVKSYQQSTYYTSAPAAAMSLMHWYGMLNDQDLNAATEQRIAKEMHTGYPSGTRAADLASWLQLNGFDVIWGDNGSMDMLRDNLNNGIPTIVLWSDWGGHFSIVTGYYAANSHSTTDADTIFFADSTANRSGLPNPDGIMAFNALRFSYMWFSLTNGTTAVRHTYITAIPRSKRK